MSALTPERALQAGFHAAQAVVSASQGDAAGAITSALNAALELAPADDVKKRLDEMAVARAEEMRQDLNDAKFGPRT